MEQKGRIILAASPASMAPIGDALHSVRQINAFISQRQHLFSLSINTDKCTVSLPCAAVKVDSCITL